MLLAIFDISVNAAAATVNRLAFVSSVPPPPPSSKASRGTGSNTIAASIHLKTDSESPASLPFARWYNKPASICRGP